MPSIRPMLIAACAVLAFALPVNAQQNDGRPALQACRADMRELCAGTERGGGRIIQCLREHRNDLSDGCRTALSEAREAREGQGGAGKRRLGAIPVPKGTQVTQNIAYGSEPEQRLDVYRPATGDRLPVIVMMHGGAWTGGSKSSTGVVVNKVGHWLPKGYVFVSVETRLVPKADPLQQAGDLAAALAFVQKNAASWGGDASKIVLMGHSAGAHIAALISADRSIGEKAGLKPWAGTVALDSAAYDVTAVMNQPRHPKLYDTAFGKDPEFWAKVSPTLQIKSGAPPMLLVCSSLRRLSCRQAETFAAKAAGKAQVLPVALRHGPINSELGEDSGYTRDVDDFLASIGVK